MSDTVPTRNVVLTDAQAELVHSLVTSGRYQNASEVIRDGLRLLERREAENAARLAALRAAAADGVADIERGQFTEISTRAALKRHLDELAREALQPEPRS